MAQKNRNTLKGYFNTGDKPTEQQFGDLIDSFVHRLDDSILQDISTLQNNIISKVNKDGDSMLGNLYFNNSKFIIEDVKTATQNRVKYISEIQHLYNFPSTSNYLVLKHKLGTNNCFINIEGYINLYNNKGRLNFKIGVYYSTFLRDRVFIENSSDYDFLFQRTTDVNGNLVLLIKKITPSAFGSNASMTLTNVTYSFQGSSSVTWNLPWELSAATNISELNINSDIVDIPKSYDNSLILKSPNGKLWKVNVNNDGQLTTTEIV